MAEGGATRAASSFSDLEIVEIASAVVESSRTHRSSARMARTPAPCLNSHESDIVRALRYTGEGGMQCGRKSRLRFAQPSSRA